MLRRPFLIVLVLCGAGCGLSDYLPPKLPTGPAIERSVTVEQGWSDQQRHWFHHTSQGTATMLVPFEWFMAFEQPEISLRESPLLSDPEYLRSFGFIASPKSDENPGGLPVGFARDGEFVDPTDGRLFVKSSRKYTALGFTCAACHTGHLEYRGTSVRIEGGPAMTDLGKFRTVIGLAAGYTDRLPFRFPRFADRVLGEEHSEADEELLRSELKDFLARVDKLVEAEKTIDADCTEEGFCRLDAITRIGNFVFGTGLDNMKNMAPRRAPVNYPHIWDTPWFDWVQYNGSIHQPMIRNAGEAMGVLALVSFSGGPDDLYRSTVRVDNLHHMERQLAGPAPDLHTNGGAPSALFRGLRSPGWPEDILGKIDRQKAAAGAELYEANCQGCHLPPIDSAEIRKPNYWTDPNGAGEQYLKLNRVPIERVGTDPGQAKGMRDRMVDTGPLGLGGTVPFGVALKEVVERTVARWYDDRPTPLSAAERMAMNGNRENRVEAEMVYRARPLDGIWATAPYLHNGSVPNLYFMLSPASERPRKIYLGNRQFDPKEVGFEYAEFDNSFLLDTTKPGNSNAGHEFRDGPKGNGVIGPAFTDEQRWQLIEYLKTL